MQDDEQADSELVRELYARFGLAYFRGDCLHRQLSMILAWSGIPQNTSLTRPRMEELLARSFSLTLGDVGTKLEQVLPPAFHDRLRDAVRRRNFLAHQFWFERAHLMVRVRDVLGLIEQLDDDAAVFERLDADVTAWSGLMQRALGITEATLAESLGQILDGASDDPLPDKRAVRDVERALGKRQRLVRVWDFALEDGRRPLVFEFADGSFWQLSDVGLGSTRFKEVGSDWVEHPAVRPYLPADIQPRPPVAASWDYIIQLAQGAVLWVKPGRQERTFKWGVRAPGVAAPQGAAPVGD